MRLSLYFIRRAIWWFGTDAGIATTSLIVGLAIVVAAFTPHPSTFHRCADAVVGLGAMLGVGVTAGREPKADITKPIRTHRGPHG